jgi:hypothetical protein
LVYFLAFKRAVFDEGTTSTRIVRNVDGMRSKAAMNISIEVAITSEATHQRVFMPCPTIINIPSPRIRECRRARRPRGAMTDLDAVVMHVLFREGEGVGWWTGDE